MRVQCFIDGYNLYHAIDDLKQPKLHWFDIRKLVQKYLRNDDELTDVYFFTAKPVHLKAEAMSRHRDFLLAQRLMNDTKVIEGQFKRKYVKCNSDCGKKFRAYEEKESDVNLAVNLVGEAYRDNFDVAIVVTADSDLLSPIKYVKEHFPTKSVWLLSPPKRASKSTEMIQHVDRHLEIQPRTIRACLMNERIYVGGELQVERPSLWARDSR